MPYRYGTEAHRTALAADNAWSEALCAAFGAKAGDVRYSPLGQGEEGSELRRIYEARRSAQEAWHRECEEA